MRGRYVTTAALLLIAAASRGEGTMWTLYRILLRLAAAWGVIVGMIILIAGVCMHSSGLELVDRYRR